MSLKTAVTNDSFPQESSADSTLFLGDILQHFPVTLFGKRDQEDSS